MLRVFARVVVSSNESPESKSPDESSQSRCLQVQYFGEKWPNSLLMAVHAFDENKILLYSV